MSFLDIILPEWWRAAYFGALLALPPVALVFAMVKILGRRWRLPAHEPLPPAKVPDLLRRHAQPWVGRMGFLGYPMVECTQGTEGLTWRMASQADQSVAILEGNLPKGGGKPEFRLRLMSFLSDGRTLVTTDGPFIPRVPARWQVAQGNFKTLEEQVLAHRSMIERSKGEARLLLPLPEALSARLAEADREVFDTLLSSGDFVRSGADETLLSPAFGRTPAMAFRYLGSLLSGSAHVSGRRRDIATVAKDRTKDLLDDAAEGGATGLNLDQLVERDIQRFRDLTGVAADGKYRAKRLGITIATVALVVAVIGRDSIPLTALKVLGILAFHEFGHWLAMRIFGFTGMGNIFVPFIGPSELGRKLQAPAWQQLAVILAGPVPGLFLGLAMLIAGYFVPAMPAGLLNLSVLAVVLNAIYLLPFLPLDGGKVVDLLIFRDLPIIRPFFTGISAGATLIASLATGSRILRFIALGMFAGLAWDFKMIKVVRGGRKHGWAAGEKDEKEALRRIFTGVRQEQNDAFLRSGDWFKQIDVLLTEVLRKRPRMITRLFGGAFYAAACLMPVALVIGVGLLVFFSGLGSITKQVEASAEFDGAFPHKAAALTQPQAAFMERLVTSTTSATGDSVLEPSPEQRRAWSAKIASSHSAALDKLDWKVAGQALADGSLPEGVLSAWLELLCGKMEGATREGRQPEAARRAEVMLHIITSLEPAPSQFARESIRDAELRALASIEKQAASGKLDAATIQRIEGRINQLNKAPLPEVENKLLVEGWTMRQIGPAFAVPEESDEGEPAEFRSPDMLWKQAYRELRTVVQSGLLNPSSTSASVALARHWKKSRKVGELPAEIAESFSPGKGEAEYIAAFCEGHRRTTWRRMTTLSALRFEAHRQKVGKLPEKWEHELPGGGKLILVQNNGPCLQLSDQRQAAQKALPAWLGGGQPTAAPIDHLCPLYGAQFPELSRK